AALFAVGKFLIGLYLGKSSVGAAFGAAGSLVVLMLWVYYSAQIFLFGAEFTWVYAHEFGSRRSEMRPRARASAERRAAVARPAPSSVLALTPMPPISAEPSLRRRHPFGSVGAAFVAGLALGAAKWLATAPRRATARAQAYRPGAGFRPRSLRPPGCRRGYAASGFRAPARPQCALDRSPEQAGSFAASRGTGAPRARTPPPYRAAWGRA